MAKTYIINWKKDNSKEEKEKIDEETLDGGMLPEIVIMPKDTTDSESLDAKRKSEEEPDSKE